MGRELPAYPTLFAKFREALTGPYDNVIVPTYAAAQCDWDGELAVIISHIVTLQPGDVICTGTPGSVGHARKHPVYIQNGETVEVTIEGLGTAPPTNGLRIADVRTCSVLPRSRLRRSRACRTE